MTIKDFFGYSFVAITLGICSLCLIIWNKERIKKECLAAQPAKIISSSDNKETTANSKEGLFIPSAQEDATLSKWQNSSMDSLFIDAFKGDSAALWMVAMTFFTGQGGWFIDTEIADDFMSFSASLGFAPAIDNVARRYINCANPYLGMVYMNLTITFGHSEYISAYHDLLSKEPNALVREIEKIALHKHKIILRNLKLQKESKDYCLAQTDSITDEDILFGHDYWKNAFNGNAPKNIDEWVNQSDNYSHIIRDSAQRAKYRQSQFDSFTSALKEK